MKKAFRCIFLSLLFLNSLAFSQDVLATIFKTSGNVTVRQLGKTEFDLPARNLLNLHKGEAIRTGQDGFSVLMFKEDKSLVKVWKNSLVELSEDYSIRTLKMKEGKVFFDVKKGGRNSYRIETPTSVASVKGTQFWVISSPEYGDRFYGVRGEVEIINLITGMETMLQANQMVISTNDGKVLSMPVESNEIPSDEENQESPQPEGSQEPEPGQEMEAPPEGRTNTAPPSPLEPSSAIAEAPQEAADASQAGGSPYGMGLGLGSVTIDGQIYNQIALRPELRLGKFGMGLDLIFYFDEQGKIRKNEWDEFADYLDKIYYIRWARKGDPFFLQAGALDNVTLGYGILMHGYSNTTEYPQIRKIGVHTGFQFSQLGIEAVVANTKEMTGPGLIGGRLTFRASRSFPLTFGATIVSDINQYKGLRDTDADNIPDAFDAFADEEFKLPYTYPENAFDLGYGPGSKLAGDLYNKDSDGDGIPDELDYDIDGDGLTDNYHPDPTKNLEGEEDIAYAQDPFNIEDQKKSLTGLALDVGYPIFNNKVIKLYTYGQAATFLSEDIYDYRTGEVFKPGWGIAVPGVKANILSFINANLEYRHANKNFLYNYWDRAYDYERVIIRTDSTGAIWPYTKDEMKMRNVAMNGIFGALDVNILNYIILGSYYQHMTAGDEEIRSFMASASIPRGKIPKLAHAIAFYQRNNDKNPFQFKEPSENTIWGYRVGFDVGGGAILSFVYQVTYRDLDGSGTIDPDNEAVKLTTIETGFSF